MKRRNLWYKHNALEPTRPLIFCDPENGWNEIIRNEDLKCQDELLRSWEMTLRKEVFWGKNMQDDRVIEPFFNISHVYEKSDWGMHETRVGGAGGGAYHWDGQLAELDFLEENGLLSLNNDETYVGSGGFGFTRELPGKSFNSAKIRITDMWGFAESQETSGISPELFKEFVISIAFREGWSRSGNLLFYIRINN